MTSQMLKNVKKPYKEKTAKIYAFWRSIPFIFREIPLAKLRKWGFETDENSTFPKMLECKTKTQFAQEFKMSPIMQDLHLT